MKTIILGSGKGSNAGALLDASSQNLLGSTEIVGASDAAESGVLKIADSHNIENDYLRSDSSSLNLLGKMSNYGWIHWNIIRILSYWLDS